jgi:hypothetical protein
MNETETRQRREDFALATFQTMLAANPTKTWAVVAAQAVRAADALILELDKPQ